jgi:hypothetical protein
MRQYFFLKKNRFAVYATKISIIDLQLSILNRFDAKIRQKVLIAIFWNLFKTSMIQRLWINFFIFFAKYVSGK